MATYQSEYTGAEIDAGIAKLNTQPSAAANDGNYIIDQDDGEMSLVPDIFPAPPVADGTYQLQVTIENGTAVYTWVSV